MAQTKHKKSKAKKPHTTVKKHGKQADLAQLRTQLDVLGLKIVEVTADGNCFFRALADQLEGNEVEHRKYRSMVVQYILDHRADFEPFIEDDVPFDEYCQSMAKDGTWAGHMELQAASLVTRRNICIHQAMSPRWYISNFTGREANLIHLSYHDGEHYNSVRLAEDSCEGPPKPIIIKVDANVSAVDANKKVTSNELKGSSHNFLFNTGSVKLVMAGTGCANIDKVEQVLREVGGDVDAAIEFFIAEQKSDINLDLCDGIPSEDFENDQNGNCELPEVAPRNMACEDYQSRSDMQTVLENNKKVARNKECSCGSKKKNKACCDSAVRKIPATTLSKTAGSTHKGKKESKQDRKRDARRRELQKCKPASLPDVGALCI